MNRLVEQMGMFSKIGIVIEELRELLMNGEFMNENGDGINPRINELLATQGIQIDPKIVATRDVVKIGDAIAAAKRKLEDQIRG